jgi:hypothetical protein
MLENIYCDTLIYQRLAADATFVAALGGQRIYRYRAPQNGQSPNCFYRLIDAEDFNSGNQQGRLIVSAAYEISVRSEGFPTEGAKTAAHRMDELFRMNRRVSFTVGSVTLSFNSWRVALRPTNEPGAIPEKFFIGNGALYQFEVFNNG